MSKEVISETYKKGKSEMDSHPHFKNVKEMNEIISRIRFRRAVRRLIKIVNCK